MYKRKPHFDCHAPDAAGPVNVLALNASLKRSPDLSNTGELAELVMQLIVKRAPGSRTDILRLADCMLPVGLGFREGTDDDWPAFVAKMRARVNRLKNDATAHMAMNLARNLVYYAQLLKVHPLVPKAESP